MDLVRHFLIVRFQQLDGLFERLEHLVSGGLAFLDRHEMSHTRHQPVIITLLHSLRQATISVFDEVVQLSQTGSKNITIF